MLHTDTLRTLLSDGLSRDEALVQLRDTGVSPVACVKAWLALQALDAADATGLVAWLMAMPSKKEQAEHARREAEASPDASVALAFATLGGAPVRVETVVNQGSWYSLVTARDGNVLWWFVCERSVWCVEASPVWDPDERFGVDLLARHFVGGGLSRDGLSTEALMQITVADVVAELGVVRPAVLASFRPDTGADTRDQLQRLR